MGTRFVATDECDASPKFKQAYLNCRKEDITIIDSPVGLPGRAIRGEFLRRVSSVKGTFKCSWKCLRTCNVKTAPYCIAIALANAKKGVLEEGFAFAGANAYRVNKIVSVKELIATLAEEYMGATTQKSTLEHQIQSMPSRRSFTVSMCSFRRPATEAVCR
jgi:NAD(P)H-dependent flavin oxidoreductase YrpB (nitropropane dioxygenase family)